MRWILIMAAIFGASSVIVGASLRHIGGDGEVLQIALRYHQFHSVVLLALGLYALDKGPNMHLAVSSLLFATGIIIFSGSLYSMVVLNMPILGILTPVGGIVFIFGWLSLAFVKSVKKN